MRLYWSQFRALLCMLLMKRPTPPDNCEPLRKIKSGLTLIHLDWCGHHFVKCHSNISDYIRRNLPAVDSKTVPVARSDLTTPWPGKCPPPSTHMHVTWTSPAGCHVNTEHSRKLKQLNKHSLYVIYLALLPKSN